MVQGWLGWLASREKEAKLATPSRLCQVKWYLTAHNIGDPAHVWTKSPRGWRYPNKSIHPFSMFDCVSFFNPKNNWPRFMLVIPDPRCTRASESLRSPAIGTPKSIHKKRCGQLKHTGPMLENYSSRILFMQKEWEKQASIDNGYVRIARGLLFISGIDQHGIDCVREIDHATSIFPWILNDLTMKLSQKFMTGVIRNSTFSGDSDCITQKTITNHNRSILNDHPPLHQNPIGI